LGRFFSMERPYGTGCALHDHGGRRQRWGERPTKTPQSPRSLRCTAVVFRSPRSKHQRRTLCRRVALRCAGPRSTIKNIFCVAPLSNRFRNIDKALASGALDSFGIFTFRVNGTREQIVEQILEVCELWNEPMTRAKAEAKADAVIRTIWGQRVFAWLSWVISILAVILALLLIIGTFTAQAGPCAYHPSYEWNRVHQGDLAGEQH
jgi:hypothetical protein